MAAPVPGLTTAPAPDHCRKGRQCSKFNGHKGRCNSERSWNTFWKNSPVYNLNVRKRSLALEEERVGAVGEELAAKAARLDVRESELREGKLDMQKKLDDTGEYKIGKYQFTSQQDNVMNMGIILHNAEIVILKYLFGGSGLLLS